jgi:hypothetical protein
MRTCTRNADTNLFENKRDQACPGQLLDPTMGKEQCAASIVINAIAARQLE